MMFFVQKSLNDPKKKKKILADLLLSNFRALKLPCWRWISFLRGRIHADRGCDVMDRISRRKINSINENVPLEFLDNLIYFFCYLFSTFWGIISYGNAKAVGKNDDNTSSWRHDLTYCNTAKIRCLNTLMISVFLSTHKRDIVRIKGPKSSYNGYFHL